MADAPKNCDAAQCDNETETCLELESNKMKKALCIPTRVGECILAIGYYMYVACW